VYPILDAGELPPPPRRLVGRLEWTIEFSIPTDTPPAGDFYLEIVSARTKATGRTAGHLSVTADGAHDESDVGVWCVCGNVSSSTRAALGDYVQCDECGAWLHTACEGAGFQSERCVAKHFFFGGRLMLPSAVALNQMLLGLLLDLLLGCLFISSG
jgi:hypothetical protein